METVRIQDFGRHVGKEVLVQGWLHNKRSSGKLQFLIVRDGSGFAQGVMAKAAVPAEAWDGAEAAGAPAAAAPSAAAQPAGKAINIEAELLTAPGKFQVNGGKVVMQPMVSFGSGWSGSRQLFWSGGATGAVLDLLVDIPASGTYAVEVYFTRAPDYANLRIEVGGKPSPASFVGYAAKVTPPVPTQAGKFPLQAGQRRIAFMIVGKQQQSTNYFVGIDRIRLYPVGAQ